MRVGDHSFEERLARVRRRHDGLLARENEIDPRWDNGIVDRYRRPVLTAGHVPLEWRYDFDRRTNPRFLERLGVNALFNSGAILDGDRILLVPRIEGADRKSFFAVAESSSGTDRFRFWDEPIQFADNDEAETNHYDMRLTRHEDGWIYGLFCVERKDPAAPPADTSTAVAGCGIVRTKDFRAWERLPDLQTPSPQQRNVVLHPELVGGKYFFYTRPMDDFLGSGSRGGIGWGVCERIERPVLENEGVMEERIYHTIKEGKLGAGGTPLKTARGWLHIAHGVRGCAAGARYVLYAFLCAPDDPARVIARPGGYFMAPVGWERLGDVSNVLFTNGVVARPDGAVFLYYASSDTRLHVATSTVEVLLDYVENTPPDGLRTSVCVGQRIALARRNKALLG